MCVVFLLQFVLLFCVSQHVSSQLLVEDKGCKQEDCKVEANLGWPFELSCQVIIGHDAFYGESDDYSGDHHSGDDAEVERETLEPNYRCEIFHSNGSLLLNETGTENDLTLKKVVLPDVRKNDMNYFNFYLFELGSENCWKTDYKLTPQEFQPSTCKEFFTEKRNALFKAKAEINGKKFFVCDRFDDVEPQLAEDQDYEYKWYHNCSEELPEGTEVEDDGRLNIQSIGFQHGGIYSCSVTYKGMTRFASLKDICVFHGLTFNQHTFSCSTNEVFADEGDKVVVNCSANFGTGQARNMDVKFTLQKENEYETACKTDEDKEEDVQPYCTYNLDEKCFLYDPTAGEKEIPESNIQVQLVFKNVRVSDYGKYVITSYSNRENTVPRNETIVLKRNPLPDLVYSKTTIIICVCVMFFFIIVVFLVVWKLSYVKALYKINLADYDIDDKEFGASLLYNFSKDLDRFIEDDIKLYHTMVNDMLKKMKYAIYDPWRDGFMEPQISANIQASIASSHRLIIFLTSGFVLDNWSQGSLYMGLDEMINISKSNIIFIIFPGVKQYLKRRQKEENDDASRVILSAIKQNYAIQLPAKKRNLYFRLKAAMPKLRPKKPRIVSNSSSGYTSTTCKANGKRVPQIHTLSHSSFSKENHGYEKESTENMC